jgi:tetratricopeptide (TPR) repeat protein
MNKIIKSMFIIIFLQVAISGCGSRSEYMQEMDDFIEALTFYQYGKYKESEGIVGSYYESGRLEQRWIVLSAALRFGDRDYDAALMDLEAVDGYNLHTYVDKVIYKLGKSVEGRSRFYLGDCSGAIISLREIYNYQTILGLPESEASVEVYKMLGECLNREKRYEELEGFIEETYPRLTSLQDRFWWLYSLASLHARKGRNDKALGVLSDIYELDVDREWLDDKIRHDPDLSGLVK